jgi:alginate O-acetyltransferase complex protein AlgJ
VNAARTSGVDALDLTGAIAALPGERYFRTDTHWNENGARGAAQAIAAALRARGLAEEPKVRPPAIEVKQLPRPGDLVRVAGLEALPALLRPEPEITVVSKVPPLPSASDDLFGTAGLPTIALVGTSYSRSANFAPFLERQLGGQVANAAKEGGDFDGSLEAYLASAAFRETPPRVVIWEIPERVLEK